MKILMVVTYYEPHVSGLTIYVERIGEELARRGHQVTVMTSAHIPGLAPRENIRGVEVVRLPVALRLNKGVVPPTMPWEALRLARRHDVVHMHLPLLASSYVAWVANLPPRKKTVITYHCDVILPRSPLSGVIMKTMGLSHWLAAKQSDHVVTYTKDYAEHSPFLAKFKDKVETVFPPIVVAPPDQTHPAEWRKELGLDGYRLIGFAGRFSEDKGGQYLLASMQEVLAAIPNTKLVLAGEYRKVIGENYFEKVKHLVERNKEHVLFLGELKGQRLSDFYSMCDVLVLPSVNSTESFGMVQVEAMICGTPVVASDIPGVRQPVNVTGMGKIIQPRDPHGLAQGLIEVLENPSAFSIPKLDVAKTFGVEQNVDFYEALYGRR